MQNIQSFLANLSHHPGVYQMLGENGEILYIGKAKDLKKRIASYFSTRSKDLKTTALVKQIADIVITVTASDNEAVLLECNLIKKHKPRYNVLLRDGKSYPYIFISKHDFPRIDLYRGTRKKNGFYFGPYPNPKAVRETLALLQKLFQLRTCTDSYFSARTRPCLLYQIGRCTGPCVNMIDKEAYAERVRLAMLFLQGKSHLVINELQHAMEIASKQYEFEVAAQYRDQIARLRQIQSEQCVNVAAGNADVIGLSVEAGLACIQLLSIRGGQILGSRAIFPSIPPHTNQQEILSAFLSQHYLQERGEGERIPKEIILSQVVSEAALFTQVLSAEAKHQVRIVHAVRGERAKWLKMANTSAKQSLLTHIFNKTNLQQRLKALQVALELPTIPKRVECYDISHSMGEATVASCVVFDENGPLKRDYRKFNIKGITPGDDIAAMYQVILRRFSPIKEAALLPDLVLIDGGKAQLNSAKQALEHCQFKPGLLIGVAKGSLRKPGFETIYSLDRKPFHLPADSLALHYIQQIRDEAHRFAITGHRQRRDRIRRQSSLELIPGIGAKRRRELLRYFGGIQGIAHASLEELMKVSGISRFLAEKIFATLHDTTL